MGGKKIWYILILLVLLVIIGVAIVLSSGGGGGGYRPTMAEPTEQATPGTTWTLAVFILAIIGIGIGYFILREALFTSVSKPSKKKKRK